MPDLSGKTLGQYQILEPIGSGGMAHIYRAYQPSVKREVVVKVLSPALRDHPSFVKRFTQEVDVIAHLQHPHIIPVYDFGQHEDDFYIVMAYMRGGTLAERIDQSKDGLPGGEIIRLLDLIADGLDYAHAKNIIHRDLKPNNILMDERDNPYIADFGLAKPTEGKIELTNTMMTGTAAYMAPEIARYGKSTRRADIYALGVILFEMLTGHLPYQGDTPYNLLSAHIHQPIPKLHDFRPDLPEAMQSVIDKAIAKEPEDRYATAKEMATAFKTVMNAPRNESVADGKPPRRLTFRLSPLWMAIATLLIVAGILSFLLRGSRNEETPVPPENKPVNPTFHIAEPVTTSNGEAAWTFGCLGDSASAIADLDCREIRIAVENRILPYNYIFLETNQPGGMDYDMWWEICTRLHCQPLFIEEKWDTLLGKVRTGVYDASSEGITITEERRQTFDFSISYMNIEQRLVVRKGESRFSNISEFLANDDLIVGALEDSTNYEVAKQFIPENRIRTYKEFSTVFYALATGDIDAAIADQVEGESTISGIEFQQAIKLEFVGASLSSDQFGVVFPKGSDLVGPVNQALRDMRVRGALDTLVTRYFGPDFNLTYNDIGLGAYGR
jgi:polar amino acid transport system substrate-binding protein